jgi:hypothetical protein
MFEHARWKTFSSLFLSSLFSPLERGKVTLGIILTHNPQCLWIVSIIQIPSLETKLCNPWWIPIKFTLFSPPSTFVLHLLWRHHFTPNAQSIVSSVLIYVLILSVFYRLPTERYTQGGKFWVRSRRDHELEGARNTKFRQVRAARCVIPYVLLYCLWCRMIWRSCFERGPCPPLYIWEARVTRILTNTS